MLELAVTPRTVVGKASRKLLQEGKVPGVVYGPKISPETIQLDSIEFGKVLSRAGESTLVLLSGLKEPHEVLIQAVDRDPVSNDIRHVDFYAVERGKEIEVTVALEFVGEAPAEKAGAQIVKVLHEVTVKSTPGNLPSHLDVDISVLTEAGDSIHIKDIAVPQEVTISQDAEDTVVIAQEQTEEAPETSEEVSPDAVEAEHESAEETKEGSEE